MNYRDTNDDTPDAEFLKNSLNIKAVSQIQQLIEVPDKLWKKLVEPVLVLHKPDASTLFKNFRASFEVIGKKMCLSILLPENPDEEAIVNLPKNAKKGKMAKTDSTTYNYIFKILSYRPCNLVFFDFLNFNYCIVQQICGYINHLRQINERPGEVTTYVLFHENFSSII